MWKCNLCGAGRPEDCVCTETQRDAYARLWRRMEKAEAERDALRAEVERLRGLVGRAEPLVSEVCASIFGSHAGLADEADRWLCSARAALGGEGDE